MTDCISLIRVLRAHIGEWWGREGKRRGGEGKGRVVRGGEGREGEKRTGETGGERREGRGDLYDLLINDLSGCCTFA